ncbi:MAG: DUF4115 domain-containing protein [Candidatus Competibacter sp.]|nr:DUF4115 domain-containing protein [Candidatus Competibacter sp.]MDG4584532.1 DUF4115 domain-containing protein [Candidatus Competibacter sp.]
MSMSNEMSTDFTPSTEAPEAANEPLGAWLTQVRTGYGAEQRDVAHHLGLNPAIIQALETDDFARLGAPVFVRGYLSRYARLLNLPEQAVLERYRQQSGVSQAPPPLQVARPLRRQTRIRDLRGLFYLLLVAGIGWTAIQHLDDLDPSRLTALWSGASRNGDQPTATTAVTAATQTQYPFQPASELANQPAAAPESPTSAPQPATLPSPPPAPVVVTSTAPPVQNAPPPAPEPMPAPSLPGVQAATAAPIPSSPTEENGDNATTDAGAKLLLEFSGDCWVEVKDAEGKVLISSLMRTDSSKSLSGPGPFAITLGNAPAARLILDGQPVDKTVYVPRRGTVSRFTLARPQP